MQWFLTPLGRAVGGGVATAIGAGLAMYANHTPLWLAPISGLGAGVALYFVFTRRSKA